MLIYRICVNLNVRFYFTSDNIIQRRSSKTGLVDNLYFLRNSLFKMPKYMHTVLQLGFEKGRVSVSKRALSSREAARGLVREGDPLPLGGLGGLPQENFDISRLKDGISCVLGHFHACIYVA